MTIRRKRVQHGLLATLLIVFAVTCAPAFWRLMNPLAFHKLMASGKVVDESGNTIAGAKLGFSSARFNPTNPKFVFSRQDGTFDLTAEDGLELHLSASHPDYIGISQSSVTVFPPLSIWREKGSVTTRDQVTLVLRKSPPSAGLKLIGTRKEFASPISTLSFDLGTGTCRDGTPTGPQEIGFYLEVEESVTPEWNAEICVPGGGVQARTDTALFVAPDDGYQESLSAHLKSWASTFSGEAFIHLPDGTYARVAFRISADRKLLIVSGYRNPTGSRNLKE